MLNATQIKLTKFPTNTSVVIAKDLPKADWSLVHDYDKNGLHLGTMTLTIHEKVPNMVKSCLEMSLCMAGGSLAS